MYNKWQNYFGARQLCVTAHILLERAKNLEVCQGHDGTKMLKRIGTSVTLGGSTPSKVYRAPQNLYCTFSWALWSCVQNSRTESCVVFPHNSFKHQDAHTRPVPSKRWFLLFTLCLMPAQKLLATHLLTFCVAVFNHL